MMVSLRLARNLSNSRPGVHAYLSWAAPALDMSSDLWVDAQVARIQH
jgi:hypothetical protein